MYEKGIRLQAAIGGKVVLETMLRGLRCYGDRLLLVTLNFQ